jgi:hypothetical protein
MIVRYLAYLLFLTLRRGSFYVSLAIGQLLHQFDRRETRLFYDILTQSDSARMKDTGYIGKQRLELLKKVCQRFDGIIQTIKTQGGEKQIVAQEPTQPVKNLVRECLRRFTPLDTACVINSRFDVTDIPGLYASGSDSDEDRIEMHRIHTVIDPDCFARFVEGLYEYARALPDYSPDTHCNFESADQRLSVPRFASYTNGNSRGDRFQVPSLTAEDHIRLRRTLATRARRRRSFNPNQISVYVDDSQVHTFELVTKKHGEFSVGPDASVIEVRGKDEQGELLLATLLVELNEIPAERVFKDTVVDQGGQKVEVQLNPIRDSHGLIIGAKVQVTYDMPRLKTFMAGLRAFQVGSLNKGELLFDRLAIAGVVLLLMTGVTLLWFQNRFSQPRIETHEQAGPPSEAGEKKPGVSPKPSEPEQGSKKTEQLIAHASWSRDPESALRAIQIEPTRAEATAVNLSDDQSRVFLSLPLFEDDQLYTSYRVVLARGDERYWQQTLRAPKTSLTGSAHILDVVLYPKRLTSQRIYDLRVEGLTRGGWKQLGHVLLQSQIRGK